MKNLVFSALLTIAMTTYAAETTYVPSQAGTSIAFEIPYTAGIHRGTATEIQGSLVLDANNALLSGRFTVPLAGMKTQNETRDCHMREALGIDYTHSSFPAQHVCDSENETPATGPDSIAFPNLEFEFKSVVQTTGELLPVSLEEGKTYQVVLRGRFAAHGQSRVLDGSDKASTLTAGLTKLGNSLKIKSAFPVVLKDYGIKVKPSQAGPVTISVGEKATVTLVLNLNAN